MRSLSHHVTCFIAPSRDMLAAASEFGFPTEKLVYRPHGFERLNRAPARALPARLTRFGFVGSLVPHKGVHDLIAAFERMPDGTSLAIYGSLDDAPEYVARLRAGATHPRIRFLGERPPRDVPKLLSEIDALVAPSIWRENAPLGVQEALGAGRPVVASELGGHRELLANGGGLLYPPGDVEALAGCLRRLFEEPGLGRELVAKAPRLATLDEHVEALDVIYREASRDQEPERVRGSDPEVRSSGVPDRVIFLDRDGVINRDDRRHVRSLEDWQPIPGSIDAIVRLSGAGFRVVVLTNQSGVARDLLDEAALSRIHAALVSDVRRRGGEIAGIYHCPHAPASQCDCRKPRTGLIERARLELGLEIRGAPLVGDRASDLSAAHAAGCRPIFVRSGVGIEADLAEEWCDVARFDDLASVADALLAHEGPPTGSSAPSA